MKVSKEVYRAIRKYPDAYDEGMEAAIQGVHPDECPYHEGTPQRCAWRAGYLGVS